MRRCAFLCPSLSKAADWKPDRSDQSIAPARQFPRYDFPDSGVLQAGSEPGLWANACRFGLNLSGVTPGEREFLAIRCVTAAARLRRSGPARLDSLQRAAAMCRIQPLCPAQPFIPLWHARFSPLERRSTSCRTASAPRLISRELPGTGDGFKAWPDVTWSDLLIRPGPGVAT